MGDVALVHALLRPNTQSLASMRAVASVSSLALRPASAPLTRTFHQSIPLCLHRNSEFVDERRQYKQQLSELRKKFQAEISDNLSQRAQQDAKAKEDTRSEMLKRRALKAEAGAVARAENREMHAAQKVVKIKKTRKGQKQFSNTEKHAKALRKTVLTRQDQASARWIYSEEQIERAVTEETMRPYFPSFVWRPIDTRHFQGTGHTYSPPVMPANRNFQNQGQQNRRPQLPKRPQ